MSLLEINEKALRKFGENFVAGYRNVKGKQIEHSLLEETYNHQKIICHWKDGYEWRLNSIYEPDKAAEKYGNRYKEIHDYSVICVFGLSDGKAIRQLLTHCNGTQTILIYEPDLENFLLAMENFPLDDIWAEEKLYLIVEGINDADMQKKLHSIIIYDNRLLTMQCILPNYDVIYPEQGKHFIEDMLYHTKLSVFVRNTEEQFAERFGDNLLCNLPYIINGSSITELKKMFLKNSVGDVPAIIVSAGPSLDKNIKELKKAEGKAFIIGVDSALKALVREGIHFQIAVSVDPRKNPDVFADDRVNEIPYMVSGYSLPLIARKNKKRLFFEGGYGFDAFGEMIEQETGKKLESVMTGGSVATDALSLAIDLGFRNIILVGQDLAFTDGRGHVSGFEKSEQADREHIAGRELTEVEANGGGKILTDIQMASYLQWFEMKIKEYGSRITVYNATEGGARIHGAVETSLAEVIVQLCKKPVDFDRMIAEVPDTFSDEERKRLFVLFQSSDVQLEELEKKIIKGVGAYHRIIELENQSARSTPEYKQCVEQIYTVNQIEDDEKYMTLIKLYAKKVEYETAEDIYTADELSLQEIAQRGADLLEGYLAGLRICRQRVEKILIPELDKILGK